MKYVMEKDEIIEVLIDAMTKLHEIEAEAKATREMLEVLSVEINQN